MLITCGRCGKEVECAMILHPQEQVGKMCDTCFEEFFGVPVDGESHCYINGIEVDEDEFWGSF
jgi:hypothetical protein